MMLSVLVEVYLYLYLMVGGCYHCVLAQQVLSPTPSPTSTPSSFPTLSRNLVPSNVPSRAPSIYPTSMPTSMPTYTPSSQPSFSPTEPLECANALFMTITLGPSSADAFDDFSTIEQWQNMTSSFIYDFYDGAINTAEDGNTIEVFDIYTTYTTHYKQIDNLEDSRHLKAMVKYTDDGVVCKSFDDEKFTNDRVLYRNVQSDEVVHIYAYFGICLRYRPSIDSSVLRASDIVSYPLAGRIGRENYVKALKKIEDTYDAISVTRMQVREVPGDPSATPTARPFGSPTALPSATYIDGIDTWSGLRQSAILTSVAGGALLVIFEVCRRLEMSSDVFDRRRSTRPLSTPPPLMKRTFYEWLRVNTSPSYSVWAGKVAADDEVKTTRNLNTFKNEYCEEKIIEEPLPGEEEKEEIEDDLSRWSDDLDNENIVSANKKEMIRISPQCALNISRCNPEYDIETMADTKAKKVISSPTDDDLDLLEEGKPLSVVKKLRRQRLGTELVPGKISMTGKSLSISNADAIIKGKIDDHDIDILYRTETNDEEAKYTPNSGNNSSSFVFMKMFKRSPQKIESLQGDGFVRRELKNRLEHLGTDVSGFQDTISPSERELLRCVGLDTFSMLRFLRVGCRLSFVSFVVAAISLIPLYVESKFNGFGTYGGSGVVTVGYYDLTYNKLESGSPKFWILWVYAVWFVLYVLFTLWKEWEFFVVLRFEFLAARSFEEATEMNEVQLVQYRNSCMVNCIPSSYQSDREIFKYFDAVFPGKVKRAEVLVNASNLTNLIEERKRNICLYEDIYAKHVHDKRSYTRQIAAIRKRQDNVTMSTYLLNCFFSRDPKSPSDPMIDVGDHFHSVLVKALPHYLSEIKRVNARINKEADRLIKARKELRSTMKKGKKKNKEERSSMTKLSSIIVSNAISAISPVANLSREEMVSDTAFIEFKNLTTKESAIQCNISGTSNFITCRAAPTPNDIIWENATKRQLDVDERKWRVNTLLLVGVLFWTPVVSTVSNIGNPTLWIQLGVSEENLPSQDDFLGASLAGILPVLILELLMIVVVKVLSLIGNQYIQFKTKSENEEFVLLWHFAFRLVNLLAIMVSGGLVQLMNEENLKDASEQLAAGIASNSDFFLDNAIVGAGFEALFELAQFTKLLLSFVVICSTKAEAKSQRYLERLEETQEISFEEQMPHFVFFFMASLIYAPLVPLVNLGCAVYFFVMYKVWHHQALFVYAQKHEGGGRFVYIVNRMIFIGLYLSILITTTVFALNEAHGEATTFAYLMTIVTVAVDYKVNSKFVKPSATLALLRARELDEEDKLVIERVNKFRKIKQIESNKTCKSSVNKGKPEEVSTKISSDHYDENYYLYRQPMLNKTTWETKPRRYR